jgi:hypothetical protein
MHNCEKQQKFWPYWIKCYGQLTTVQDANICTCLNAALYIYRLPVCLSACLPACLCLSLSVCLPACLPISFVCITYLKLFPV